MITQLRIGSRASKLAQKQAEMVRDALKRLLPECAISIHSFTTKGDKQANEKTATPFVEGGFKGLFTKELQQALLAGDIDLAVHSVKDMPSILPDGLCLSAMLPRDDVRDAWISQKYPCFDDLPANIIIGTASLRRAAQARLHHPSAAIKPLRGNVQTRLDKLANGAADGSFLSCAGLDRIGLQAAIAQRISTNIMLPAVAQGTIGIECHAKNAELMALCAQINCQATSQAITAERSMLRVLDGSCATPIAGYATIEKGVLHLRAQVVAPDGSAEISGKEKGSPAEAEKIGQMLGEALKSRVPKNWLRAIST
jgi:hydroxymethylbilane synthase